MTVRFEKLAVVRCRVPECGGEGAWRCVEEVEGETVESVVCQACAKDFAALAGVELVEVLASAE